MPALSEARIQQLLAPYLPDTREKPLSKQLPAQLSTYLDLLLRWNARTNLTAIRQPEEVVQRHFGESLFAGAILARELAHGASLLDLGSGAGFPGLPMQLLLPGLHVTLAESQGKKAVFLREVIRTLGLNTEVWAARVETMPAHAQFDAVTMRAVDKMAAMESIAKHRLKPNGILLRLTAERRQGLLSVPIPGSSGTFVELSRPA